MSEYYARADYTYDGSTELYSVPFDYIDEEHVVVIINDDEDNPVDYTWQSETQIMLDSDELGLEADDTISIRRITPVDEKLAVFTDGNILDEETQNTAHKQILYAIQELADDTTETMLEITDYFDKELSDYQSYVVENYNELYYYLQGTETSVTLSSLTKVRPCAFAYDTSLTTVNLPSCTEVGDYAFYNCTSLKSAYFPSLETIGDYAFYACILYSEMIDFSSVKTVGDYAFEYVNGMNSIDLPVCETIGDYGFHYTSLEGDISLPSVITLGDYVFYSSGGITSFNLPECTSAGYMACAVGEQCTSLYLPKCTDLGAFVFAGTGITEFEIADGTTLLQHGIFKNCSNLKKLFIPSSVTTIYSSGTNGCIYGCSDVVIYAETESAPSAWYSGWSFTGYDDDGNKVYADIHYGCSLSDYNNGIYN